MHLVYAWSLQRVGLNAVINTPTAVKPTPDTDTFSAAASTQPSYKWIYRLTCLSHVSTILDRIQTCPLHPLSSLSCSCPTCTLAGMIQPHLSCLWCGRTGNKFGAGQNVCANVTKWKGMQIGDLITSRPLLHPVGSNVSLAEKFPACFSCTIIHLSTALQRLFFYFLHPFSNI